MEVYEKIKKLREDHGYTQKQVAKYLEIDQSYLSKIEQNQRNINSVIFDKLCLLYGCSSDYLLGKTEEYTPPKLAFRSDKKLDLFALSKMNQIVGYLKLLREIEEDITHE
ncbi:MAG: helix-turn-helix transcriptional regulator [Methanosphaera stadtmanae]|nr:helix-turn-helix transcriptional regulator [Methanosphaera stadtmanae]